MKLDTLALLFVALISFAVVTLAVFVIDPPLTGEVTTMVTWAFPPEPSDANEQFTVVVPLHVPPAFAVDVINDVPAGNASVIVIADDAIVP
jgi:hypothetical protein